MAEPSQSLGRRAGSAALLVAILASASACGLMPGGQGDPNAPILVQGRVVDADGVPAGSASLQLQVFDLTNSQIGVPVPVVFQATYTASIDGTFAIHLVPPPELIAFVQKNNQFANFDLIAISQNGTLISPWAFPREIKGGTWAGDIPVVDLKPIGTN